MSAYVIVYIAGPYRGADNWQIEQNVRAAETLALAVWQLGAVALCPHSMTRYYQGALPDHAWLSGDLELLRRCDALILTPDWERSPGARAERDFATGQGLQVFHSLAGLRDWLDARGVQPWGVSP